jgi:hypothetical protein
VAGVLVVTVTVDMANTAEPDVFSCGINTGGATDEAQRDSWRFVDLSTNSADTWSTQTALAATPGNQVVRVVISSGPTHI